MRRSLLDYFYENASNESDVAFSHRPKLRRKSLTYTQIARSSFQFARELESREIGHGDRIIILGENSPEWIIAFYGALLRGVIVVPLDEQSSAEFTARVADQTKPKLIIADMASNHTIPTIAFDNLTKIISHHSDKDYEAKHIARDDIVEIVFTSGTTAEPKGVELTHENLLANIEPIERAVDRYIKWEFLVHPIKILNLLPLSHVFGQVMGIFMPQLFRAEVVFQNHLNPADIIETIKYERVAVLASVPRILENLRRKIERDFEDELKKTPPRSWPLRWVKYHRIHRAFGLKFLTFVTGGATLDAATEEFWADLGFAVVQGYGMTETAALISLNNPFSAKRGSLGEIIAGHDVKIGEGGEILVRGKNISPGYWNGTLSAPPVITDEDSLSVPSAVAGGDFPIQNPKSQIQNREWLHTGDIGSIDDTGRLYFKGRKKDVIVTASGLNIYPEDLEAALNRQPEIKESAVVGINGPNGPEPIAALIPA
jgi:Long-chain acyl-CoA synthetases (AMP-forming)